MQVKTMDRQQFSDVATDVDAETVASALQRLEQEANALGVTFEDAPELIERPVASQRVERSYGC